MAIVFGEQRAEVRKRAGRDHHAAGVLAGIAGQVLQLQGEVDEVADVVLGLVALPEFADDPVRFLLRARAGPDRVFQRHRVGRLQRDQLGQSVDEAVREAEHAAGIAQHRLRRHGAVGDDLGDAVAAVLARDVVDDLVAAVHAEVDVEVRHRHAFRVEEALEQQVVRQRVEVGDAQRPRHQRTRARAAARPDRDPVLLGPVDEVGHDQEVAGESHRHDDAEFEVQPRLVVATGPAFGERCLLQPLRQPLARLAADPAVQGFVAGHRECRQEVGAEAQFQVAALRQRHRVVERVRRVGGEQRGHFLGRFQVLLGAVVVRAARIVQHPSAGDAYARLMRVEAGRIEEAHVIAGDHRDPAARRHVQCERVEGLLAGAAGAQQFQVQAFAEAGLQPGQRLFGEVVAARGEKLPGLGLRPGDREQPRVRRQPCRPRDHPIDPMAFHPRPGQQLRQAQVAGAVAAQQGDPGGRGGALGDQHVGAGDRLDADLFGFLVELHQREQVVLVGDRHRRQAARRAGGDEFRDADRRVDQRILAVQVQVGETGGHRAPRARRRAGSTRRVGPPPCADKP